MKIDRITSFQSVYDNKNVFTGYQTNPNNLYLQKGINVKQSDLPSRAYFHPSFCQLKPFPDSKIMIYGAGGHLFNGRFKINEIVRNLFNEENISIYDPDIAKIKNLGLNIKSKDSVDNSAIYLLSPSVYHTSQVANAIASAKEKNIKGVYIDKAMCVVREQLPELQKSVDASEIPLYFGDHYYFSNVAGLRLMGADIPYGDRVKINFDKTKGNKFTQCINNAQAYFKPEDIKKIESRINESDVNELVARPWYKQPNSGGGVIIDLQLHIFNMLNLMGLKISHIDAAKGLKYPYSEEVLSKLSTHKLWENENLFDNFKKSEIEDAAFAKGKINGNIPFDFESVRYATNNDKYIIIEGKNNEKIKFLVTGSEKKVQLLGDNGEVNAEALIQEKPYSLLIENAQGYFSGKEKDSGFLSKLYNTQKSSMEQVFDIKDMMGI